jgi:hypothetical protein
MIRTIVPIALLLAGCVPLLTVTQPEAEFVVTDDDGVPLEGALVTFASQLYGPNGKTTFVETRTDRAGRVNLERQRHLQLAFLIVDGIAVYGFSYCVEKSGFRPVIRNHLGNRQLAKSPVVESLAESAEALDCVWSEDSFASHFTIVDRNSSAGG